MFKEFLQKIKVAFSRRESSRLKVARLPVALLIQELQTRLERMRSNPVGVDRLSEQGYLQLINDLIEHENRINEGPFEPNDIWGILEDAAPFFTTMEYIQILDLAKNRIMVP